MPVRKTIFVDFPKRKLGKFDDVGSALGTERKREPPTVKTAAKVVENGYFDQLKKFPIDMLTKVSKCFSLISKKRKVTAG